MAQPLARVIQFPQRRPTPDCIDCIFAEVTSEGDLRCIVADDVVIDTRAEAAACDAYTPREDPQ